MHVHPYLTFGGDCAEAIRFYAETLGGRIETMFTHAESPMANQNPAWRDKIMHARLVVGDTVLMGSDRPPDDREPVSGFSVSLNVDRIADAERVFAALADRGEVRLPLQQTFWAVRFGMLVDRFGIPWMINCEKGE